MTSNFINSTTSRRIGLGFVASLAVAGVSLYFAKRNVASKRKADLDEYRAGSDHPPTTQRSHSGTDTSKIGS